MQIKSQITALFILLICGFFVNCSKDENLNLPPSLQKLTEQTECSCNPYIDEYTLNENTIYIYSWVVPPVIALQPIMMLTEKNFNSKAAIRQIS